ncbi:MAG: hypothetical protein HYT72_02390 [Candidatus Aenigmarchaeota archaeon]|nr:hypothetical protein [Candidatus Aenigmarchaeota archaeon]
MFAKKSDREDKVKELEKRIEELENQLDQDVKELKQRTKEQIRDLGDSFKVLKDVMGKVQKEKNELEADRNFLIEKHKELIRSIPVDRTRLKKDIRERLLMPLHRTVKENAELIQKAALEDLVEDDKETGKKTEKEDFIEQIKDAVTEGNGETKTPIDDLFELVMKNGKIKISDAAKRFGVFEARIEEWAKILENHGLIELHYPAMGKPEMRKKTITEE